MELKSFDDYDEGAYVKALAKHSNALHENVKVEEVNYKVEMGIQFQGNEKVSPDDGQTVIAKVHNVDKKQVEILSSSRRLAEEAGRRMAATEFKVRITTADKSEAKKVHEKAQSSAGIAEMTKVMKEETGIDTVPVVTAAPKATVEVKTSIVSHTQEAIALPTGDDLHQIAKESGASNIKVTEQKVTKEGESALLDDVSSSTATSLAYVLLTLAASWLFRE